MKGTEMLDVPQKAPLKVETHDFEYLPKPVHPTVLLSRVQAAALLPAEPNAA